jgi:hypothetical protein
MLTPQLFKQALETAASICAPDKCLLEDAMADDNISSALKTEVAKFGLTAIFSGADPVLSVFDMGLHVGYRLHQLELESDTTPIEKDKVN